MDLLFEVIAGKTVIFLAILPRENCPDLIYKKYFFSEFQIEGSFSKIFYSFY